LSQYNKVKGTIFFKRDYLCSKLWLENYWFDTYRTTDMFRLSLWQSCHFHIPDLSPDL